MEREYTLPEAAENVGASVDQLRYWITLMEIESTRRGKCRYLAEEDVSRLRGMAAMVKGGTPPKEAATLARERPTEAVIIPAPAAIRSGAPLGPNLIAALAKAIWMPIVKNNAPSCCMKFPTVNKMFLPKSSGVVAPTASSPIPANKEAPTLPNPFSMDILNSALKFSQSSVVKDHSKNTI